MLTPLSQPAQSSATAAVGESMPSALAPSPISPAPEAKPTPMPASGQQAAPISSLELRRLYRKFALVWVGTVVLLSAVFGGILYFVIRGHADSDSTVVQAKAIQAEEEAALRQAAEKEHAQLAKRRTDFRQLMIEGGTALGDQHFEKATHAYQKALQLFPDNVEAAKGMSESRSLLEARAKAQEENAKRQAEFTRLMDQGKEAMKAKQFPEAVRAFDTALRVVAGSVAAVRALRDAQAALDAEQVVTKKEADYDRHMTAARAAMVGQRYVEARDEFLAALQVKPDDPAAANGRRLADKGLDDLKNDEVRRAEFTRLMNQGTRAVRNRRFDQAVQVYANAVKLFPKDLDARQALREAQNGLNTLRKEFNRLMEQGDVAMQTLRIADAVRAYGQASKLLPDNEGAKTKLEGAQKILADLGNTQAVYNRLMILGATATRLGRFADATLFFGSALQVVPGDPDALLGLQQSRAALLSRPVGMFP
jgi:cytochrome c-type biogenesis protein CcmH/NrfG